VLCYRFPEGKVHSIDTQQDAMLLLRTIGNQKQNKLLLREYRPHMLASSVTFLPGEQVISFLDAAVHSFYMPNLFNII